ncbi:MAG TPA: TolC family protein [Pyrinomonadaceae bacterium]
MVRLKRQTVWFMLLTFAGLTLAMVRVEPSQAQQKVDTQLERAATDYKSSLQRLLALYERDSKRAEERLTTVRELFAQGLVTRRELETAEAAAAQTREKVAEAQAQLNGADMVIAEALVEAQVEESTPKTGRSSGPRAVNSLVRTTAYIRYGGAGAWSLADAAGVKQFFARRFGRALPIGAFGQSALHDRWGYDHRNAMDVGVNPDSNEGQALMEYLRANGIPFTAFHFAVPGVATGPHIHVGLPSHRIAPKWVAANSGNMSGR